MIATRVLPLALVAALGSLSAPALAASTPTPTPTQSATSVTVFLRPAQRARLGQLAATARVARSHADRLSALRTALPTQARHALVASYLSAHGLHVTDQSAWSVTASGRAADVARVFGARPKLPSHPSAAQRRAATGALPHLPAGLRDDALAAFPTTGGPAAFRPLATSGSDYRNAYASAALTRSGVAPFSGGSRAPRLTIATVQLAGWNPHDLASYASRHHLPYSSSTLTQVPVDQASVPTAADNGDDSAVEVDLDQESILSTDPYAHQRAYFAPNTEAGFADAFSQVVDDVTGAGTAYRGGDSHVAALSVSWGECEALTNAEGDSGNEIGTVLEPIMQSLVAAGVTIFASSGDAGSYDCYSGKGTPTAAAVDYPASSPEVVAVGGTRLSATSRTANTGSNWHETAWSCATLYQCTSENGTGGSGGGTSSVFPEPAYQSQHLGAAADPGGQRLVPDIAANADAESGFEIYTSDPHDGPGSFAVGGTSLASPVSAALLTDTLAAHGVGHGVGDIHEALYAAAATPGVVRDITSGTNGAYRAGVGYDEVTGLGAVLWPAFGEQLFAGPRPSAAASITRPHPRSRTLWRQVAVAWRGAAPAGTVLSSAEVTVRNGAGAVVWQRSGAAPSGSHTFTGARRTTYRVYVTTVDSAHTMSAARSAKVYVPRSR